MLPKSQRLNLKTDFKWVASGKRIESKLLTLFIKHGDNKYPRIGIASSNKFFKKAHERNRARRLVSEAFHNTYYLLPNTTNILALPKLRVLEVKSGEVLLDLQEVLRREGIL